ADVRSTHGRPLAEIVRDHELLELASTSAETGLIQRAEVELLHQRRFLHAIAAPISTDPSQGVLLTLQDVTSLRQVQNTRREFVSNVSHELRTPLASVRAMVETLDGGAIHDTDVARDFLSRIESDVERMTAMVDELLELSSLESGQMPIHLAPVELCDVAGKVIERFEMRAGSRGVKLLIRIPDGLPYLMADAGKLDQILTNLVENALKFTPEGGHISLSAKTVREGVQIEVADTGIGIPREHLPHIFERFYKVDRSRRDVGTGLGLAITRRLAEAHGGDITVSSVEGEGSVFTFNLSRAS
ncbi:MAG: cell wall metabolism sensor histidine kinase WalK, partial [Dehalococcoidia bacterium]|nr:cell wall metabolism sensor histidine kinase WalK [Dehalococcoidia bacterium]